MKTSLFNCLLASVLLASAVIVETKAQAQLLPTAAVLLSNHKLGNYTVSSTEDYVRLESDIAMISKRLSLAFESYSNLQYRPSYNENEEIVGFIVTGVNNWAAANDISSMLMQLEVLSEIIQSADDKFYPAEQASSTRVTRKEAIR